MPSPHNGVRHRRTMHSPPNTLAKLCFTSSSHLLTHIFFLKSGQFSPTAELQAGDIHRIGTQPPPSGGFALSFALPLTLLLL